VSAGILIITIEIVLAPRHSSRLQIGKPSVELSGTMSNSISSVGEISGGTVCHNTSLAPAYEMPNFEPYMNKINVLSFGLALRDMLVELPMNIDRNFLQTLTNALSTASGLWSCCCQHYLSKAEQTNCAGKDSVREDGYHHSPSRDTDARRSPTVQRSGGQSLVQGRPTSAVLEINQTPSRSQAVS
jgi:hypothetical protein